MSATPAEAAVFRSTDELIALEMWHKADFSNLKGNPETLKVKREGWILGHDAEAHAYNMYPEVVASLHAGD